MQLWKIATSYILPLSPRMVTGCITTAQCWNHDTDINPVYWPYSEQTNLKILFISLFLAVLGLRGCAWASSGFSEWGLLFLATHMLLITVASLVELSYCGLQQSWCTGLVAPRHVESSQTRDRTCVPCIGRRILNHWTTRKVAKVFQINFCFNENDSCTFKRLVLKTYYSSINMKRLRF